MKPAPTGLGVAVLGRVGVGQGVGVGFWVAGRSRTDLTRMGDRQCGGDPQSSSVECGNEPCLHRQGCRRMSNGDYV